MTSEKRLYARFAGEDIFREQGRLLYSLLHAFATNGYEVHLHDNLTGKSLDKYGDLLYTLPALKLIGAPPTEKKGWLYLYDKDDSGMARHPWRKSMRVRFDLFSTFRLSDPIIMPFPVHPLQANVAPERLDKLRKKQRKLRIFFSGDTDHYVRNWVRYPAPKMPRKTIVDAVVEDLPDAVEVISDSAVFDELSTLGYTNKLVLTGSSEIRIEPEHWLDAIAAADFFLSPPGIVMPMCHNIIEAMAVGTIPITNYPEWLDPALQHRENCIVFDDRGDLIDKLRHALQMEGSEIARLRQNVIDYYKNYLRSETFIDRIEQHPDTKFPILMYTERNMALKTRKLGRRSILLQGTTLPRKRGWAERAAMHLLR
jgi:hypothetical protein